MVTEVVDIGTDNSEEPHPEQNPVSAYLASLRPVGRRTMLQSLNAIAGLASNWQNDAFSFPWYTLRQQDCLAIVNELRERYKPATATKMLAALRHVLYESWKLGQMSAEQYRLAINIPDEPPRQQSRGRSLSAGEIAALLNSCDIDSSPAGPRDAALLALMYGAGLSRADITVIEKADYDPATGALTIRSGKGEKDRFIFLSREVNTTLTEWLEARGEEPGPLFYRINRQGQVQNQPMTSQALLEALEKRAKNAGVAAFSPQDLRRTFLGDISVYGILENDTGK